MYTPDRLGHQPDVARHRWTVIGVAGLVAALVGTLVVLWVVERVLVRHSRVVDQSRSALAAETPVPRDAPPLQPSLGHDASPAKDLATMRAGEDRVFAAMGWRIDPATDEPQIPQSIVDAVAARKRATSGPATTQAGGAR